MSKYPMPAIPNDIRQAVIAWNLMERDRLEMNGDTSSSRYISACITLASLDAEPKAYSDFEELAFAHATSDMWPEPLGFGKDIALYPAPPVPALKLPDEMTLESETGCVTEAGHVQAVTWWNRCIEKFKRLNGMQG